MCLTGQRSVLPDDVTLHWIRRWTSMFSFYAKRFGIFLARATCIGTPCYISTRCSFLSSHSVWNIFPHTFRCHGDISDIFEQFTFGVIRPRVQRGLKAGSVSTSFSDSLLHTNTSVTFHVNNRATLWMPSRTDCLKVSTIIPVCTSHCVKMAQPQKTEY